MTSAAPIIDDFVEAARSVTVTEAAERLGARTGLKRAGVSEHVGPCPACGGTDRFGIHSTRGWVCRGSADGGGKDGISLAAHLGGHDVKTRDGFLAACADALGQPVPDGRDEDEAARSARERELASRRADAKAKQVREAKASADFRERERGKARGKWVHAAPIAPGDPAWRYLTARLGGHAVPTLPVVRVIASETYWHGKDERGNGIDIHVGPAIVAPFVDPNWQIIGCHLTWLDSKGPKGRPELWDHDERLPTKKMRGSKKGGLIPLIGWDLDRDGLIRPQAHRHRLVIGEGIENVLAVATAEGPDPSALYAAAGDLGNLAGPADPKSAFSHPTLKKETASGLRPQRVQGPEPRSEQGPDDAVQVPDFVREVLLVADGDSEPYATAAAMLRAERRIAGAGRTVATAWPPPGCDFADMLAANTTVAA